MASNIAVHLLPESCYVCGRSDAHDPTTHNYCSNADADSAARSHDARATCTYPSGAHNAEGHYIATHRPD